MNANHSNQTGAAFYANTFLQNQELIDGDCLLAWKLCIIETIKIGKYLIFKKLGFT